jgi:peptide-methionine (S)-S-oxide reductase
MLMNALLRPLLAALLTIPLLAAPAGAAAPKPALQTAVLAGGCFWGMEDVFENVRGVTNVVVGYSGGTKATADYETVSSGSTGHAESVQITFDPAKVSYKTLLDVFFTVAIDPTQLNSQGPDTGTQYRSVIFYANDTQKSVAKAMIAQLTAKKVYAAPIVTQVVPFKAFYAAEDYHQHFADKNPDYPYIVINDAPKVAALKAKFPKLVKSTAT